MRSWLGSVAMITAMVGAGARNVWAQGTLGISFTYQGQLLQKRGGVDGVCDFEFSLWTM